MTARREEFCQVCLRISTGIVSVDHLKFLTQRGKYTHMLKVSEHMEWIRDESKNKKGTEIFHLSRVADIEKGYPDFHQYPGFQKCLKICFKSFDDVTDESEMIDLTTPSTVVSNGSDGDTERFHEDVPTTSGTNPPASTGSTVENEQSSLGGGRRMCCVCGKPGHLVFMCGHGLCVDCWSKGEYGDDNSMCGKCRGHFSSGGIVHMKLMDVD